jgi:hypothetical protein
VYPKDVPIPSGEDWYYEIGGRTHGPIARDELEAMLSRAGETALEVRVRKGTDGSWSGYRTEQPSHSLEPAPVSGQHVVSREPRDEGAFEKPTRHATKPDPLIPADRPGLRRRLAESKEILAIAILWITVNAVFIVFWGDPYAQERRYLDALEGIVAEVDELQGKPTSDAEWRALAAKSKSTLAPIVQDLKRSASAAHLPRQQLLWCAQNLAPKIIGPRTKERDADKHRLKEYLQSVNKVLEHGP